MCSSPIPPEIHAAVATAAEVGGKSINQWAAETGHENEPLPAKLCTARKHHSALDSNQQFLCALPFAGSDPGPLANLTYATSRQSNARSYGPRSQASRRADQPGPSPTSDRAGRVAGRAGGHRAHLLGGARVRLGGRQRRGHCSRRRCGAGRSGLFAILRAHGRWASVGAGSSSSELRHAAPGRRRPILQLRF
ncbi:MAG: toxin-antitoxin system HicB family antitoxin [Chloroflexota bacterium]|nr:toxin-antitoxin system HicB family antitoxin [Chloroflexota bacterium]